MNTDANLLLYSQLDLDRTSRKSLQTQIYEFFRQAVLSGRLSQAAQVPSTRQLAKQWNVSRTTLVCAYDKLIAEGYFFAQKGAATRVASELPDSVVTGQLVSQERDQSFRFNLSRRGKRLLDDYESRGRAVDLPRPFRPGVPAIGTFPTLLWRRLSSQVWSNTDPNDVSDMDSQGHQPLREQVSKYVEEVRGVVCKPNQVFVVTSTQHAISLICQVLVNPADSIAIESPGYPRAFAAFSSCGAQMTGMPIDREGMVLAKRGVKTEGYLHNAFLPISARRNYDIETTSGAAGLDAGKWVLDY